MSLAVRRSVTSTPWRDAPPGDHTTSAHIAARTLRVSRLLLDRFQPAVAVGRDLLEVPGDDLVRRHDHPAVRLHLGDLHAVPVLVTEGLPDGGNVAGIF